MKDHEIAQLVNILRDTALQFHDHQSLRERIVHVLMPMLEQLAKVEDELGAMNANYQALMQEFKAVKHRKRELETEVSDLRNTLNARQPSLTEAQSRAIGLFTCWWSMILADNELAGEPIDPESVALHFMGSGASCMVHAKDLSELCNLLGATYGAT